MALDKEKLTVKVDLDAKGAIKSTKELEGAVNSLSHTLDDGAKSASDMEKATKKMGDTTQEAGKKSSASFGEMGDTIGKLFVPLTTLNQGLQLVTAAMSALTNTFGGFVEAFARAELAQTKLEKSIALVGERARNTADEWDNYLDVIEKTTGADADFLKGLVATGLQIGLSEKQTKNLVDASVRLAEVTGKELAPTAEQLLQSFKGQARTLAVYAPEIGNLTEEQIQNGAAVDLLLEKYKNVEFTFGKTLTGALNSSKIRFDDLRESIGESISKAIDLDAKLRATADGFATLERVIKVVDFGKLSADLGTFAGIAGGIAVLSMASLRAQIVRLATALVAAAGPAALLALKFTAIGAGVATLAVAVDLAVRNFGRLDDVFKVITTAVGVGFLTAVEAGAGALGKLFDMIPGAQMLAVGFRSVEIAAQKASNKLTAIGVAASEGLDFGMAGGLFDQGKKMLEAFNGELTNTGELLKDTSDKAGPRIGSVMDPELLKKLEEQAKAAAQAFATMGDSVRRLQEQSALLNLELATGGKGLEATERQYQITLQQIAAEREKAILAGLSAKAADEQASKAVALAELIRQQSQGFEIQKNTLDQIKQNEQAAEEAMRSLRQQTQNHNEALLRLGMNREQILQRELQIELDKIDAIEAQVQAAGKLDKAKREELNRARQAVTSRSIADRGPTEGLAPVLASFATTLAAKLTPVTAIMAAAETIVAAVQKVVDFIPNILNAVTKLFTSVADLPMVILAAVRNLTSSIVKFTSDFIPNVFRALPDIVDQILTAAFETIPDAAQKVIEMIPSLFENIINRLPKLVAKLVAGLVSSADRVGLGIIRAMIQNLPGFFKSVLLYVPRVFLAIVEGIITGLRDGIVQIGDAFASLFGKSISNGLEKATGSMAKLGTGISNQLFAVAEMATESRATQQAVDFGNQIRKGANDALALLGKLGQRIWNDLVTTAKAAIADVKAWGQWMWDGLVAAFDQAKEDVQKLGQWIWDGLTMAWEAAVDSVKKIGSWIWDGLKAVFEAQDAVDGLKKLGLWIWQGFLLPLELASDTFKKAGAWIWEGLVTAFDAASTHMKKLGAWIWDGLTASFDRADAYLSDVGGKVWQGFKNGMSTMFSVMESLGSSIWNGLKNGFNDATNGMASLLNKLNPSNLLQKVFAWNGGGIGAVEKFLGLDFPWSNFATGGVVPGRARVFGDSLANDTVPALLSPGEAVIPRSLMADPAVSKLVNGILSGQSVGMHAVGKLAEAVLNPVAGVKTVTELVVPTQVRELYNSLSRFISGIDLTKLVARPLEYTTELVKNNLGPLLREPFFNAMKFASGGMVPGSGTMDTQRAFLTPGEFVVSRRGVQAIGTDALQAINRGQVGTTSNVSNISVNLTLNATEKVDANYVKDKLMPAIKDELRKESRRGGYIIAAAGVRT